MKKRVAAVIIGLSCLAVFSPASSSADEFSASDIAAAKKVIEEMRLVAPPGAPSESCWSGDANGTARSESGVVSLEAKSGYHINVPRATREIVADGYIVTMYDAYFKSFNSVKQFYQDRVNRINEEIASFNQDNPGRKLVFHLELTSFKKIGHAMIGEVLYEVKVKASGLNCPQTKNYEMIRLKQSYGGGEIPEAYDLLSYLNIQMSDDFKTIFVPRSCD